MELQLRVRWDDLQSSLWFRPLVVTLLAIALAIGSTTLDRYVVLTPWLTIGADNARAILSSIASSMLTVVALTFSIIMVALVLASQQFSPRILRNFARDHASQNVLSIFIGTFIYSLLVMALISEADNLVFVPITSILIATALALLGVGALIYFIDHIAKDIRVNYIIADINWQTMALLAEIFNRPDRARPAEAVELSVPIETPALVVAPRAGYVQGIDTAELLRLAEEYNLVIRLDRLVGDFIAQGASLLHVWPPLALSEKVLEDLHAAFDIGPERTTFQDLLFGLRQLVDIALKAISPAINDPTTAINCLDALSNILIQAARYPDPWTQHCDDQKVLRLIYRKITFADMVDLAFSQIRQYARSEVAVTLRLLEVLTEVAQVTTHPQHYEILWQQACAISRGANTGIPEPLDREKVNRRLAALAEQIGKQAELAGVRLEG